VTTKLYPESRVSASPNGSEENRGGYDGNVAEPAQIEKIRNYPSKAL
jgi:hypothetical protein